MPSKQEVAPTLRANINNRNTTSVPTAYNVQLSVTETPGSTHVPDIRQGSADRVSELLMLNHAKYHTLFNEVGLHNHIVHHLLSLWALGASVDEIQAAYDLNKIYQLPHYHHGASTTLKMVDPKFFKECLGKSEFYSDYLHFFQDLIAERGVENVVKEYLFKGDGSADDLLGRLHSGFLHPVIHLGFAFEFHQPLLVAEALASACIHDEWPLPIVQPVETYISNHPNLPRNSLLSVIQALHANFVVRNAVQPTDPPNRVTDGLLKRAASSLPSILAAWRVEPNEKDIHYRMAEMSNVCSYLSGAAQNPKKQPSLDFFLMHSTNLSVFYPTFMSLSWLGLEEKARLLTWKGWMDAVIYAGCGSPALYPERITGYVPKVNGDVKGDAGWESIVRRATSYEDDGHTVKLVRAFMNAEKLSEPFGGRPEFPLPREGFLQVGKMMMDSVERMSKPDYKLKEKTRKAYVEGLGVHEEVVKTVCRWVRWCGLDGAWDDVPDLVDGEENEGDGYKAKL